MRYVILNITKKSFKVVDEFTSVDIVDIYIDNCVVYELEPEVRVEQKITVSPKIPYQRTPKMGD